MKKMGFKTATQLKTAYMNALIAEGKVPAIKGGRGAGKAAKVKAIGVGKRGSIIISKELVDTMGFGAKDKFIVRKTKTGIALKRPSNTFAQVVFSKTSGSVSHPLVLNSHSGGN